MVSRETVAWVSAQYDERFFKSVNTPIARKFATRSFLFLIFWIFRDVFLHFWWIRLWNEKQKNGTKGKNIIEQVSWFEWVNVDPVARGRFPSLSLPSNLPLSYDVFSGRCRFLRNNIRRARDFILRDTQFCGKGFVWMSDSWLWDAYQRVFALR